MPAQTSSQKPSAGRQDLSVILVTGSYDHEIRFWEAWSGICSRTIARSGETGVRSIWDHPVPSDHANVDVASRSK